MNLAHDVRVEQVERVVGPAELIGAAHERIHELTQWLHLALRFALNPTGRNFGAIFLVEERIALLLFRLCVQVEIKNNHVPVLLPAQLRALRWSPELWSLYFQIAELNRAIINGIRH